MEPGPEGPGDSGRSDRGCRRCRCRNGARPRRAGGRQPKTGSSRTARQRRNGARPRRAGGLHQRHADRAGGEAAMEPGPEGPGDRRAGTRRHRPGRAAMEPGPEGPGDLWNADLRGANLWPQWSRPRRAGGHGPRCTSCGLGWPQWSPAPKGRGTPVGSGRGASPCAGRNGARPRRAGGPLVGWELADLRFFRSMRAVGRRDVGAWAIWLSRGAFCLVGWVRALPGSGVAAGPLAPDFR